MYFKGTNCIQIKILSYLVELIKYLKLGQTL